MEREKANFTSPLAIDSFIWIFNGSGFATEVLGRPVSWPSVKSINRILGIVRSESSDNASGQ